MVSRNLHRILHMLPCIVDVDFSLIAPAAAEKPVVKEWRIPSLLFLTGPFAGVGEQIKWATDQAAAEINAAGGVAGKPLVIEWHDTGLDPAKGAAEMSKVVNSLTDIWPCRVHHL